MQAHRREIEALSGNRGGEVPSGTSVVASRLSPEKKVEGAGNELEPDMRKRLINLDVNPGGDI
jgi:hypothetical protein